MNNAMVMNAWKKNLVAVAVAWVSGVLLALCYADWNLTGLVWVWMLPLFPVLWQAKRKRAGFGIAYLAGLAFWLLNLKWVWTVSGLGALAMAAFLALYFGLWGAFAASVGNPWRKKGPTSKADAASAIEDKIARKLAVKKQGLPGGGVRQSLLSLKFALVNAAAWVVLEWLRGWLFTGFGWNGLGVAFHNTPVLAQAADLVGVTGLSFLPVFMSAVLVQTVGRLKQELAAGRLRPRLDFSVAALLLALQFCYGVWRIKDVNGWESERVRLLLVQGNIPQNVKWDPRAVNDILQTYADLTRDAIEQLEAENMEKLRANADGAEVLLERPDLVIWPESAMPTPLYFADNLEGHLLYEETRHLIDKEIRPLGRFTLVSGMNEFEADFDGQRGTYKQGGRQYNSIAAIAPEGELERSIATYRKMHLVIFGEYIPWVDELPFLASLFKFSAGADFAGNFDAGTSLEPMVVPVGGGELQMIPTVCFEDTVGRLTRKFVRAQPQLIINVTNDGWFKKSEAAAQHMANAKFRAIELRRPMVRCANTGVSGIISATGSLADPLTGKRQVIEDANGSHFARSSVYGYAYVAPNGPVTLYAMLGDWFVWLMAGWLAVVVVRSRLAGK